MKNRIKELREAAGLSLDQIAERIGDSTGASTIHKLETGAMRLTTDWMERLGRALGVDPVDIIDDRPRTQIIDDVRRLEAAKPPTVAAMVGPGCALWIVTGAALDEIGIFPGDIVEVDEAGDPDPATGDVVVAIANAGPAGAPATIIREYLEPSLLSSNSRAANTLPVNMRSTATRIVGVVVRAHRNIGRKR